MISVHAGVHHGDGDAASAEGASRPVLSVGVGVVGVDICQAVLVVEFAGALIVRQSRAQGCAAVDGPGGDGGRGDNSAADVAAAGASAAAAAPAAAGGDKRGDGK